MKFVSRAVASTPLVAVAALDDHTRIDQRMSVSADGSIHDVRHSSRALLSSRSLDGIDLAADMANSCCKNHTCPDSGSFPALGPCSRFSHVKDGEGLCNNNETSNNMFIHKGVCYPTHVKQNFNQAPTPQPAGQNLVGNCLWDMQTSTCRTRCGAEALNTAEQKKYCNMEPNRPENALPG